MQLKRIEPNDYPTWSEFERANPDDPYDAFGWFTIEIGDGEEAGGELYQVLVSTPSAIHRAKRSHTRKSDSFRGLVVPEFSATTGREALEGFISKLSGMGQEESLALLRSSMYWEYG